MVQNRLHHLSMVQTNTVNMVNFLPTPFRLTFSLLQIGILCTAQHEKGFGKSAHEVNTRALEISKFYRFMVLNNT